MEKRLLRSSNDKVIAGVCGGIGEYFEVDPVLVRIITVILFFATGVGLLAYIVAWIVMPKREFDEVVEVRYNAKWSKYTPGIILIAIGSLLLAKEHLYWFDLGDMWPALLILGGLAMIFKYRSSSDKAESAMHDEPVSSNTSNGANNGGPA